MQRTLIVPVIVLALLFMTGCSGNSNVTGISATPDVFPEDAVGIWQNDEYRWGFKVEPDGSISKIIHTIGMPIVVAEGGTREIAEDGNEAIYVLGDCYADYDIESRTLAVVVGLSFKMAFSEDTIEGHSQDFFEGPISEDGLTWDAHWRSYSHIEGATAPDHELIDANPQPIIFNKLKIK